MLPLLLLLIFLKNYIVIKLKSSAYCYFTGNTEEEDLLIDDEDEDFMDAESKEPKKSFRERLNEIQEICLKVQETLDSIASVCERVIK